MIWNGKKEKSPAQNLSRIQQDSSASHALFLGKNNWSWLLAQQFFRWLVGWLVFSSNSLRPSWTPWKNSPFEPQVVTKIKTHWLSLIRVPCPSQFHVRCSPPKKISAGYANIYTTEIDHENPAPIQIRNTNIFHFIILQESLLGHMHETWHVVTLHKQMEISKNRNQAEHFHLLQNHSPTSHKTQ